MFRSKHLCHLNFMLLDSAQYSNFESSFLYTFLPSKKVSPQCSDSGKSKEATFLANEDSDLFIQLCTRLTKSGPPRQYFPYFNIYHVFVSMIILTGSMKCFAGYKKYYVNFSFSPSLLMHLLDQKRKQGFSDIF